MPKVLRIRPVVDYIENMSNDGYTASVIRKAVYKEFKMHLSERTVYNAIKNGIAGGRRRNPEIAVVTKKRRMSK